MSVLASDCAATAAVATPGRFQLGVDFARYAACSAAALALDYGVLLALSQMPGFHYLWTSALGFTCGLSLAYVLSIAYVFRGRRRLAAPQEFLGFAAIGIAGLALTQILLACLVGGAGLSVALAKPLTAIAVFCFNFGVRRAMLFTRSASPNRPHGS